MQLEITGFLEKKSGSFMEELWELLVDAQSQPSGIPSIFIEKKKQEILKRQEADPIPSSSVRPSRFNYVPDATSSASMSTEVEKSTVECRSDHSPRKGRDWSPTDDRREARERRDDGRDERRRRHGSNRSRDRSQRRHGSPERPRHRERSRNRGRDRDIGRRRDNSRSRSRSRDGDMDRAKARDRKKNMSMSRSQSSSHSPSPPCSTHHNVTVTSKESIGSICDATRERELRERALASMSSRKLSK